MQDSSFDQNTIEINLALEQLEERVGQPGFGREVQKIEDLMHSLKISKEAQQELRAQLDALVAKQRSFYAEESGRLRVELESKLQQTEAPGQQENATPQELDAFFNNLGQANSSLYDLERQVDNLGRRLNPEDRNALKKLLAERRQEVRDLRDNTRQQVQDQVEEIFQQAVQAVQNEPNLRVARERFQALQQDLKQIPMRHGDRTKLRYRFDELWNQLQERNRQYREDAKARQQQWRDRQADGIRKLEAALQRVESQIAKNQEDIQADEKRIENAHWNEVDRMEAQLQRNKRDLEEGLRRQGELQAKLADAKARLEKDSRPS